MFRSWVYCRDRAETPLSSSEQIRSAVGTACALISICNSDQPYAANAEHLPHQLASSSLSLKSSVAASSALSSTLLCAICTCSNILSALADSNGATGLEWVI